MRQVTTRFGVLALTLLVGGGSVFAQERSITGAGATFPYPIYARWAETYYKLTGLQLNYQSIGSGGGIAQIKAKTVDFGATDAPLTKEQLDASGLVQFPMIIGGVVPVVNLKGVASGQLKLTGQILADIFLGKITRWNDAAITAVNQGLPIPASAITVVHRADGSGTTWIFTNYLDKVSPGWHSKVGTDKAVAWPVGVGGKGNEGVAAYVQRIDGAIGYVEFAYALQSGMAVTMLQNRAGQFVLPTIATFQAAAETAEWEKAPGFYLVLTDQPGAASWPISGASYILVYADQPDQGRARDLLKFFDYCLRHGADAATELRYVPLPTKLVDLVELRWTETISSAGNPVWK